MGFKSTSDWEREANAIAHTHPENYARMDAWLRVMHKEGIEGSPIASVDMLYAVYEFETAGLCVLAICRVAGEYTLTHIFLKSGPKAIHGRVNRARAAARAIGHTAMLIV
jgi:hypothetical protein